jgi:hypothetical protein
MKGNERGNPPYVSNQFVAEIGHELGNVLHGLLGMARLVRDSGLNAEQDRWLRAIEQSGQQLRCLVDSFRQGPVRSGEGAGCCPAAIDGVDLLEQALLAHAPAARARANRLWLATSPELPRRWVADARLLRQLLDNLLGNALKFTRSGEVVLKAGIGPGVVGDCETLVLAVEDSGPGIRPELGERMFRAYERGHAPLQDEAGGCGLGLFICQRIVQTLGGSIAWSTPADGGARFTVTLPGVLPAARPQTDFRPSRILRAVECRLELRGAARRSVDCCLARLGVAHSSMAKETERVAAEVTDRPAHHQGPPAVLIFINEAPSPAGVAGASLLLRVETPAGRVVGSRRLDQPVLECSLGPLLLELALECLWLRNAGRGSGS